MESYSSTPDLVSIHEKHTHPTTFEWKGVTLVAYPRVFNPSLGSSSLFMANYIEEKPPLRETRVVDAGCGTGLLTIAAARAGASSITAFDCNPAAVRNCRENCERAGIEGRVEILESDGFPTLGKPIDHILCNPPLVRDSDESLDWEVAFYDPHWQFVRDVLEQGGGQLSPSGSIHLVAGEDLTQQIVTEMWNRAGGKAVKKVKTNDQDYPDLSVLRCDW